MTEQPAPPRRPNPVERGELNLHGAYFGVAEGSLFVLDPAAKEFHSVRQEAGE